MLPVNTAGPRGVIYMWQLGYHSEFEATNGWNDGLRAGCFGDAPLQQMRDRASSEYPFVSAIRLASH
jgi:hypothetical protein